MRGSFLLVFPFTKERQERGCVISSNFYTIALFFSGESLQLFSNLAFGLPATVPSQENQYGGGHVTPFSRRGKWPLSHSLFATKFTWRLLTLSPFLKMPVHSTTSHLPSPGSLSVPIKGQSTFPPSSEICMDQTCYTSTCFTQFNYEKYAQKMIKLINLEKRLGFLCWNKNNSLLQV